MARALIVGCGCRGLELGTVLLERGWQVRGTTRDAARAPEMEAAGVEAAVADPDRLITLLGHAADAALVFWLLGSARGEPEAVAALHGPRLERFLERIVDTPVRGFVYEAAGSVEAALLEGGAGLVREAAARWRIPFALVDADPGEWRQWRDEMIAAADRLTGEPS